MKVIVTVNFYMEHITDKQGLKDSGKTLNQIVKWLIKEEGLFGVVSGMSIKRIKRIYKAPAWKDKD